MINTFFEYSPGDFFGFEYHKHPKHSGRLKTVPPSAVLRNTPLSFSINRGLCWRGGMGDMGYKIPEEKC